MADLIDLDAGPVVNGDVFLEWVGQAIFEKILDIASEAKTWAEHHGIHNSLVLFNPAHVT